MDFQALCPIGCSGHAELLRNRTRGRIKSLQVSVIQDSMTFCLPMREQAKESMLSDFI